MGIGGAGAMGGASKLSVELWDWAGAMGGATPRGTGPFPSTSLSNTRISVAPGLAPEPALGEWFQVRGTSTATPRHTGEPVLKPRLATHVQVCLSVGSGLCQESPHPRGKGLSPQVLAQLAHWPLVWIFLFKVQTEILSNETSPSFIFNVLEQ